MARIRSIKPEMWSDEKLGPLEPLHKLVFIGLVSQADDAGRLLDSVRLINGLLFPYDDSTSVRRSLDELSRIGVIERGATSSNQRVIQIVGWDKHQRIDRPNLAASLPPIVKRGSDLQAFDEDSSKDRRRLDEASSPRSTIYDQDQRSASAARAREGEFGGLDDLAIASIKGLYGWQPESREGTDERVWGSTPPEHRPRCIAIAVQRLEGEGRPYQGSFFRSILASVVAEQASDPKKTAAGRKGFWATDADYKPGGIYHVPGADG